MARLVLTAIGDDRAGLVSSLATVVAEHGGNWLESRMARLGGKFAGIVLVEAPGLEVAALERAVGVLTAEGLLDVTVTRTDEGAEEPGRHLLLHLLGHDQAGIVRDISHVLAGQGASIDELITATREAPMAGGLLFEADAIIRVPEGTDVEAIRAALEGIADALMVDLDLTQTD